MSIKPSAQYPDGIQGGVTASLAHDSGMRQAMGSAQFVDDLPELPNTLHLVPIGAPKARGIIKALNLDKVRAATGVVAVLTADDVPGLNDVSPTHSLDDFVLASSSVRFHAEPVAAVIATSRQLARKAARLAEIEIEETPAILNIEQADQANSIISDDYEFQSGNSDHALKSAQHTAESSLIIGGQDQFYLEGQISYAIPQEYDPAGHRDILIYCSTQHPSEVQHNVANVLGVPAHAVVVEIRRMGGGFGGKESQATQWAALAALGALKTGKPVKCRLDRDDDMIMTGKRHDFTAKMQVGFDDQGRILGASAQLKARCGISKDLSDAIVDRAMFHFDNAYHMPNCKIHTRRLKTNTVSNTAFRGFGGPQGMLAGEWMIESIARKLGDDPLNVRKRNLYAGLDQAPNDTPYGMAVKDFILKDMIQSLEDSGDYWQRRAEIKAFNLESRIIKRGLALTPVKFGISFTTSFLNQAGALVHLYKDGSIMLNHGGTEMGQGLFVKVAQVVAEIFQVDSSHVKITATSTAKIPNTSATAASSGSDMNGMAAFNAASTIKSRLIEFAAEKYKIPESQVIFLPGRVRIGNDEIPFKTLIAEAYLARVQLSCAGFYKTPEIAFDRATGKGRPFYYFAYGAALSEVAIDCLTGESRVLGVDIVHDVGKSLNPAIDLGQIEGGFMQGLGWLMMEELHWDDQGRLRTHAPSTYKIPTINDRPLRFNVNLW
ncbi:MAG: xanthine dehydrogenase molybdopterin binding subunit, partial [Alphaproteobacteria bacterium]